MVQINEIKIDSYFNGTVVCGCHLSLTIFPMIWSLYISFHNVGPAAGGLSFKWTGITNYLTKIS